MAARRRISGSLASSNVARCTASQERGRDRVGRQGVEQRGRRSRRLRMASRIESRTCGVLDEKAARSVVRAFGSLSSASWDTAASRASTDSRTSPDLPGSLGQSGTTFGGRLEAERLDQRQGLAANSGIGAERQCLYRRAGRPGKLDGRGPWKPDRRPRRHLPAIADPPGPPHRPGPVTTPIRSGDGRWPSRGARVAPRPSPVRPANAAARSTMHRLDPARRSGSPVPSTAHRRACGPAERAPAWPGHRRSRPERGRAGGGTDGSVSVAQCEDLVDHPGVRTEPSFGEAQGLAPHARIGMGEGRFDVLRSQRTQAIERVQCVQHRDRRGGLASEPGQDRRASLSRRSTSSRRAVLRRQKCGAAHLARELLDRRAGSCPRPGPPDCPRGSAARCGHGPCHGPGHTPAASNAGSPSSPR